MRADLSIQHGGVCDGAEAGKPESEWGRPGCNFANSVVCQKCGVRWTPDDTKYPGKCPQCAEAFAIAVERCASCPLDELDRRRAASLAGQLLEHVLVLDRLVQDLQVPWTDINVEEYDALTALRDERNKFEVEKLARDRESQQQER